MSATEVREEVLLRVLAGDELADIDRRLIEPAALDDDDKAALWLLAWSCAERQPSAIISAGST